MRWAAAPVPGKVSARWGRRRHAARGHPWHVAGTSPPPRRTTDNFCCTTDTSRRRTIMKRIAAIVALSLLAGRGLAAQDTTKAAPAPAPAASPSVSVDEAVVAKGVVDRVPQDTGSVFPVDVGQLVFWNKVSGATSGGETTIHHVWFHGDTQVGDVERSEEHTSELQSQSNLVCRLLLEKKKK